MQKLGVLSFPFRCDLCEADTLVLGSSVLSYSAHVRIVLSFFMLSVISCHLVHQSCPFFDVASPSPFCLFVVCFFFPLLASSPILDTLSNLCCCCV
jgi:hypothetical protein